MAALVLQPLTGRGGGSAEHAVSSMKLAHSAAKGFHLVTAPLPRDLPATFIQVQHRVHATPAAFDQRAVCSQVQKQAKRWRCTTEALISLSQRNRERSCDDDGWMDE